MENNRVLITGASKGIGKEIAEALVKADYRVIGTCRNPDKIPEQERIKGVTYLQLDLSKPGDIDHLAEEVGDIDILINNAGANKIAPVEEMSLTDAHYLFDVIFWGHVRLTQKLLTGMRQRRSGYIINISSLKGVISIPFNSMYCAAKHALEGLSKSLRMELRKYGVNVVVIQPSYIRTDLSAGKQFDSASEYAADVNRSITIRQHKINIASEPEVVAQKVVKILNMKNPKAFYPVGQNASVLMFLIKKLPYGIVERIVRKQFNL